MAGEIADKIVLWLLRPLLWHRKLLGEKGKSGKGRWARDNKSGIAAFRYHFDGTIGGNNFDYGIAEKDGVVTFVYESMEHPDLGTAEIPADPGVLEQLNRIYLRYRLAAWDGYSKYNVHIRDGSGFSLSICFCDGASLYANGSNAFPPRYREFCEAMEAVLDPLRDEILRLAGQEEPKKQTRPDRS